MVFNKGDADSSQQNNQSDEESRMRVDEKGEKRWNNDKECIENQQTKSN